MSILTAMFLARDLAAAPPADGLPPLPARVSEPVQYPASAEFPEGYCSTQIVVPEGHFAVVIGTDDLATWALVSIVPEGARDVSLLIPFRTAQRFASVTTFRSAEERDTWLATAGLDRSGLAVPAPEIAATTPAQLLNKPAPAKAAPANRRRPRT